MPDHEIMLGGQSLTMTGGSVELWKYGTYAPAWLADAQKEAKLEDDQARRREIIFSVCAVESYLFEWVRDQALKGDFKRLSSYFPPNQRIGIVERWKQVIDHLYKDDTIPKIPSYGESYWKGFTDLVDFRNGLLHGRASRPETEGLSEAERPEPTVDQLTNKGAGWAVKVSVEVIKRLHNAVGTTPPDWLPS